MKRYLTAYGVWLTLVALLAYAVASWYRRSEEITWHEVALRVMTGDPNATDATEATGKDDA